MNHTAGTKLKPSRVFTRGTTVAAANFTVDVKLESRLDEGEESGTKSYLNVALENLIAIACFAAKYFGVPMVFAKKSKSVNIDGDMYVAEVESFTHKCKNQVIVSRKFLSPEDHVLIIDDFLANGCALKGLIAITESAGAVVEGIGIAVEKGFQEGGAMIRGLGYRLESLAIVERMDAAQGTVSFRVQ